MGEFDIGDVVTLSVLWADKNSVAINPTTVTLQVRDPSGTLTAYGSGFTNVATGQFERDIGPVTISGRWHYRWEAAGALIAAEESSFYVRRSRVL